MLKDQILKIASFVKSKIKFINFKVNKFEEDTMSENEGKMQDNFNSIIAGITKAITQEIKNVIIEPLSDIKEQLKKQSRQSVMSDSKVEQNTLVSEQLIKTLETTRNSIEQQITQQSELIEKRQEIANLRRELENWQISSIEFLETLERTIDFKELDAEYKKGIEKVISIFSKSVEHFGLQIIQPSVGDELDDICHEPKEEESQEVSSGNVIRCEAWGYKIHGIVKKRAKVIVAKYTEHNPENLPSNPGSVAAEENPEHNPENPPSNPGSVAAEENPEHNPENPPSNPGSVAAEENPEHNPENPPSNPGSVAAEENPEHNPENPPSNPGLVAAEQKIKN